MNFYNWDWFRGTALDDDEVLVVLAFLTLLALFAEWRRLITCGHVVQNAGFQKGYTLVAFSIICAHGRIIHMVSHVMRVQAAIILCISIFTIWEWTFYKNNIMKILDMMLQPGFNRKAFVAARICALMRVYFSIGIRRMFRRNMH